LVYEAHIFLGVGNFTILDAGTVTGKDAGNNFFLHKDSIGRSKAEETLKYLLELNEGVTGKADTRVRGIVYPG
jgi:amyloid beta precursor protein binding protein 1